MNRRGTLAAPRRLAVVVVLGIFAMLSVGDHRRPVAAQPPARTQGQNEKPAEPNYPPLPNDQRLLALHREFVSKAVTLAAEYERNRQPDRAAAVYGEILKLVPAHAKARQALDKLHERQLSSNRTVFHVFANKGWQDTGIQTIEGKTMRVAANGSWTFNMSHELGPDGMEIPEVLRGFKLGSLIGVIGGGDPKKTKPFYIGTGTEFSAERSGPLLVKMHDSDPSDNQGKITLEMTGQFERQK